MNLIQCRYASGQRVPLACTMPELELDVDEWD